MEVNELTKEIIGAAIEVHRALGPGLLEHVYQACLCREFDIRKITFQKEVLLPIYYKGIMIENSFRADFLIENQVIVELKSIQELLPVHEAQILTYLRLTDKKIGLLINFNVKMLKNGIKRFII